MNKRKAPQNSINKYAAKVVASLIGHEYYPIEHFNIQRHERSCEIQLTYVLISPYTSLEIYEDGIVHYFIQDSLQFEGSAKRLKYIFKDITKRLV